LEEAACSIDEDRVSIGMDYESRVELEIYLVVNLTKRGRSLSLSFLPFPSLLRL